MILITFFSLPYFIRIQHVMHIIYKLCVDLFMSSVRLPATVGSRPLGKFLVVKLYSDFQVCKGQRL